MQGKDRGEEEIKEGQGKAALIARLAAEKKAENTLILRMGELTSFTDYFVICSGTSTTHVKTIADYIVEEMKKKGARPSGSEGLANALWVLLDYGDVVVHIFESGTRAFYALEKLWLDAPRVAPAASPSSAAGKT